MTIINITCLVIHLILTALNVWLYVRGKKDLKQMAEVGRSLSARIRILIEKESKW